MREFSKCSLYWLLVGAFLVLGVSARPSVDPTTPQASSTPQPPSTTLQDKTTRYYRRGIRQITPLGTIKLATERTTLLTNVKHNVIGKGMKYNKVGDEVRVSMILKRQPFHSKVKRSNNKLKYGSDGNRYIGGSTIRSSYLIGVHEAMQRNQIPGNKTVSYVQATRPLDTSMGADSTEQARRLVAGRNIDTTNFRNERSASKHRVKRSDADLNEGFPFVASISGESNRNDLQGTVSAEDSRLFSEFVNHSIDDLKRETESKIEIGKRKLSDENNDSEERTPRKLRKKNHFKIWPDSTESEEIFDKPSKFTKLLHDENISGERNEFSKAHRKPTIHQIVTQWSDTPDFNAFSWNDDSDPDIPMSTGEDMILLNFNSNNVTKHTKIHTQTPPSANKNYYSTTESSFYQTPEIQDILDIESRPDSGQTIYIRPKPSTNYPSHTTTTYNKGDYMTFNGPNSGQYDLFHRPIVIKNKYTNQNNNQPSASASSVIINTKPAVHASVPIKIVTPFYSDSDESSYRPDESYEHNPSDSDNGGVYFPTVNDPPSDSGKPNTVSIDGEDGCPTVFVTINNTGLQGAGKEGCADIHLVINSNVLNKNVVISHPSEAPPLAADAVYDPVEESYNSYPLADEVPVIAGTNSLIPVVPIAPNGAGTGVATVAGNSGGTLASPAATGESAVSSISTNAADASPSTAPAGFGNLFSPGGSGGSHKPKPHDKDDDSLSSWLNSAGGVFAWMTFLNPFNYGVLSFCLAPLVILAAGGASLAALVTPWALPGVFERKAKRISFQNKRPEWNWMWDEGHKTWNWASYPNDKDRLTKDPRIDSEDTGIESPAGNTLKDIILNLMTSIRKWAYDKYASVFSGRKRSLGKDKIKALGQVREDWKKRRK